MTPNQLGAIVRSTRRGLGLSQAQLADAAGVGLRFLIELERGKPIAHVGKALAVLTPWAAATSRRQPLDGATACDASAARVVGHPAGRPASGEPARRTSFRVRGRVARGRELPSNLFPCRSGRVHSGSTRVGLSSPVPCPRSTNVRPSQGFRGCHVATTSACWMRSGVTSQAPSACCLMASRHQPLRPRIRSLDCWTTTP